MCCMWSPLCLQHSDILEASRSEEVAVTLFCLADLSSCATKELFGFNPKKCSQIFDGKRKKGVVMQVMYPVYVNSVTKA